MAKNNAECGKRDERELVKELKARGYSARRQPGSGNVDPTLPHDVVWEDSPIGRLLIECKWRATCGWRQLLAWKDGAPILSLKCDDRRNQDSERYVILRFDTFMSLVGDAAHRAEAADLGAQIVTPDKPWLGLAHDPTGLTEDVQRPDGWRSGTVHDEGERRAKIQAAHQDPPKRKPKPNKLGGKGIKVVEADK